MDRLNQGRRRRALLELSMRKGREMAWSEFADALVDAYGSERRALTTRGQMVKDGLIEEVRLVRLTPQGLELLERL